MKKVTKITFETEDGYTFGFEGDEANAFVTAVAKLWDKEKERMVGAQAAFENLLTVMRRKDDDSQA